MANAGIDQTSAPGARLSVARHEPIAYHEPIARHNPIAHHKPTYLPGGRDETMNQLIFGEESEVEDASHRQTDNNPFLTSMAVGSLVEETGLGEPDLYTHLETSLCLYHPESHR